MKSIASLRIEPLETRIAPATLILIEGTLVYSAANNVVNDMTVTVSGSNVVITDNAEVINIAGAAGFVLSNANHTATGPGGSVAVIAISTGNGVDTVRLVSVVDQVDVNGTGTLNVIVGNGQAAGINNFVGLTGGGGGADTLTYDNSTDASAATVTMNAAGIVGNGGGFFGASGQVSASGFETINLKMGPAFETVNVLETAAGTTTNITNAGSNADTVNVGSAGSMQSVLGALSAGTTGSPMNLVLDNSADATGRSVTVTDALVTGLAPAAISFAEAQIASFTIRTGTGADTITINSLQASGPADLNAIESGGGSDTIQLNANNVAVTLNGGTGDDVITIGSGSLDNHSGSVTVAGGGQAGDQLVLNDTTNGFADSFTISSSTISRIVFGGVTYSGIGALALNSGSGSNIFNINSTAATTPVTINGNGGNDTFIVGASGTMDGILSPLILDGGAPSNSLSLRDNLSVSAHTYVFNGSVFSRDGVTVVSSAANFASIALLAGSGNDEIDGRASASALTIDAGDGNDLVFGSPFTDALTSGPGRDSYVAIGVAGDVTVADSGITSAALGNDTFMGGAFEVVKIGGDAGINVMDAGAYTGFAVLDGVSGKDVITGSEVQFLPTSVSFIDADGDVVTIKSTKGRIGATNLDFAPGVVAGRGNLAGISLLGASVFKGTTLTLSAKSKAGFGDSFVNVGFLDADGLDLSGVVIPGDLGRIVAGDSTLTTPGVAKLAVQSLGAFGNATQFGAGGTESSIIGKLAVLSVRGTANSIVSAGDIGTVAIGGNLSGVLESGNGIAAIAIRGSVSGGAIVAERIIGVVKIAGSLSGLIAAGLDPTFAPTTQAGSIVLKSLTVGGDVRLAAILAGGSSLTDVFNADVSIGTVSVVGDWVQSNILAGVGVSVNASGIPTDTLGVGKGGAFNGTSGGNSAVVARIASITIKGQASGTFGSSSDHFSFVAQQINAFKIGTAKVARLPVTDAAFALGITGDVSIREVA